MSVLFIAIKNKVFSRFKIYLTKLIYKETVK
jgi:hypothetical protein